MVVCKREGCGGGVCVNVGSVTIKCEWMDQICAFRLSNTDVHANRRMYIPINK